MNIGRMNEINREKWIQKKLKSIRSGLKILDAGAGECKYKKHCSHLNYFSQDFNQYNGKGDNVGLQTIKWDTSKIDIVSDIVSIPKPDKYFDAILCSEVFEHIPDPVGAIKEFSRLLKKGGTLIITAPFSSLTHFSPYYYYTGFSKYFYNFVLPKYRFEIKELTYNGNYFEYLAQEIRRLPSVAKEYTGFDFGNDEEKCKSAILELLNKLSSKDVHSNEFLCHGVHVVAIKK